MKKEIFIPYLIFTFTAIGCFYVMSKNDLGFEIVSLGLLLFSIFYAYEMVKSLIDGKPSLRSIELLALSGILVLLLCKTYLFLFLGIHKFYLFFGFLILGSAIIRVYRIFEANRKSGSSIEYIQLNLYGLLILSLLSDIYSKITFNQPAVLNIAIVIGMVTSFFFVIYRMITERITSKVNKDYLGLQTNKSFWLLFGYFFIISNTLMTGYGYADEVYFRRKPKDYVELFYQAESGKENPINGKYRFQLYEEGRNNFIKRYWSK